MKVLYVRPPELSSGGWLDLSGLLVHQSAPFDVTVVRVHVQHGVLATSDGVALAPETFDELRGSHDVIVYEVGLRGAFAAVLPLLRRHPGVVLLVDDVLRPLASGSLAPSPGPTLSLSSIAAYLDAGARAADLPTWPVPGRTRSAWLDELGRQVGALIVESATGIVSVGFSSSVRVVSPPGLPYLENWAVPEEPTEARAKRSSGGASRALIVDPAGALGESPTFPGQGPAEAPAVEVHRGPLGPVSRTTLDAWIDRFDLVVLVNVTGSGDESHALERLRAEGVPVVMMPALAVREHVMPLGIPIGHLVSARAMQTAREGLAARSMRGSSPRGEPMRSDAGSQEEWVRGVAGVLTASLDFLALHDARRTIVSRVVGLSGRAAEVAISLLGEMSVSQASVGSEP